MVTLPAENEERIVRYLLDEMGEEERLQLEDRLFHESEFFELVQSVENDLILRFLHGDLNSRLASRFNQVYMNAPARRARVESARVFAQAVRETAARPKHGAVVGIRFSIAAVAAVIILGALLAPRLRKQSVPETKRPPVPISYASFLLEPGLTRSGGGSLVTVPPGIEEVQLELALPDPAGHKVYRVVLGTPEHPGVWSGSATSKDATVVARVPAKALVAGDYTLELQADGQDLATYCFRVAK